MTAYQEKLLPAAAGMEGTIAAFAHDIRTPMCCAAGAAQMAMSAARQGKDVNEQLHQILMAVSAMDRMVSSLCDVRSGLCSFTGDMLACEMQALIAPRAQEKGQRFVIDMGALSGVCMEADYSAVCRILQNLLANAVKYTQRGGEIALTGGIKDGSAVFTVRDNGMGMRRAFMRRMCLPFAREKESAYLPGMGLGLSIVDGMVHRLQGSLVVRSRRGKGSTFIVRMPLHRAQQAVSSERSVSQTP